MVRQTPFKTLPFRGAITQMDRKSHIHARLDMHLSEMEHVNVKTVFGHHRHQHANVCSLGIFQLKSFRHFKLI